MPPRKNTSSKKQELSPMMAEFQQCCKVLGFQEEDFINQITPFLNKSETQFRLLNMTITPSSSKLIYRFIQRYQKIQQVIFYACQFTDPNFFKQFAIEFNKCPATNVAFDYVPVQREALVPLLSSNHIEILSLRGNQCITNYDFVTHEKRPFPPSLNAFVNQLCTSNIKVLNLYGCHLGDDGAIAIAGSLYFNTNLLCLSLARNRIGDEGAKALAAALSQYYLDEQETAIVEKLITDESKQKISDEGGGLVKRKKGQKPPPKKPPTRTTGRKGAQSRQQIEILKNFDPQAPVKAIVLTKWNTCVTLENSNPPQKVIPGNRTLTSLILDDNNITEKGAAALKEMLRENQHMVQFSIDINPEISDDLSRSLRRVAPQTD
ncbi:hypothetical protein TRFO_25358 [Tritrichomonas foetus]|uniref:Leucine Rich Repeat family protein n=1 Tax=Tritrichomonas foetus TaxID=1144522 RepID=A0A1J4KA63_9EUKA|nr:hypothetical protein TRFO_25358 [Tritrichomonas foetus]|eukprot:OHT06550.1 hypothetical protein TRFO_25358 [Tritrichomonas foetus]